MKALSKLGSAVLLLALLLGAFPVTGVGKAQAATCDSARFISDVTVPDGTTYTPGATFRKTWQLRNIGTCTWSTYYALIFDHGEQMGAPTVVNFPASVAPGQAVDLSLDMTAPNSAGHYFGYWKLRNASNVNFGIDTTRDNAFWVEIYVSSSSGSPSGGVGFDFAANAASATWTSGAGSVPFGNMPGSIDGSAIAGSTFKLEDGATPANAILFTSDQAPYSAPHYIQADYTTTYEVSSGDRFQTTIGCELSATACHVRFIVKYRDTSNGSVVPLANYPEKHERLTRKIDINLSSLVGKKVQFILRAEDYLYPSGAGASAIWGNPIIVGTGVPTPPSTSGWNIYDHSNPDFSFMYPSGSRTYFADNKILFPNGTTLLISNPGPPNASGICLSTIPNPPTSYTTISAGQEGYLFNKEESTAGGEKWIAYTYLCKVSIEFKLSSTSPSAADLKLLETIMDTIVFP